MTEILKLNRKKIIKVFIYSGAIMTSIFLIFLFFHREISIKWIINIMLLTTIAIPSLFILASIFDCYNKRRILKNISSQMPYSQLKQIGFNKKTLYDELLFTDYVLFAVIDETQIVFNIDTRYPHIVQFIINCNTLNLGRKKFLEKSDEFKHKNIDINFFSLIKKIDTRKEKISVRNLEEIIFNLIQIAKMNEFKPILIDELKD